MDVAQAILQRPGLRRHALQLLRADIAAELDAALQALAPDAAAGAAATRRASRSRREAQHAGAGARPPGRAGARARPEAIALPAAGSPFGTHRRRQGQVHAVPELRERLPGQRAAGQPAAAAAALHREELRAVRPVRHHLPGGRDHAAAAPAAHARAQASRACSTRPSPMAACAAASRSARSRRIEAMLGKLAGHSMFQGAALERLKMCGDCRVIDIYSAAERIEDHRPMSTA